MSRRRIKNRDALVERHVQLHAEGLSLRQIAKVTGVSWKTVHRDLARWHERLLQSLTEPWPQARRLRWLVDHPQDENYPWAPCHSTSADGLGMTRNDTPNGTAEQTEARS